MTSNPTISENLWQCFAVVSKAGREAEALLSEIHGRILDKNKLGLSSRKGKIIEMEKVKPKYKEEEKEEDNNGWVCISKTRNFAVKPGGKGKKNPSHVLAVQIVFYSKDGSKAGEQSVINVICSPWDKEDPTWAENFFGNINDEEYWGDMKLTCDGRLLWNNADEEEEMEWAFSYPIHAIESPECIESKIIKPIRELLNGTPPPELQAKLLEGALHFEGEGVGIKLAGAK